MRYIFLLITLFLFTNSIVSQSFSNIDSTNFIGLKYCSIAYADVDNDGDQDIVTCGNAHIVGPQSKLFINDGSGNFSLKAAPFIGIHNGSIAFADIDNDNDPDLLITGLTSNSNRVAKLYINDGLGNFTLKPGTIIEGVANGAVAFSDIDNDNDLDLLVTGKNISTFLTAKLYLNDGLGNFTYVPNTPFFKTFFSSIAFADFDNDNDNDVIISGYWGAGLYKNNGTGQFTLDTNTQFNQLHDGDIDIADIDNDNDLDILLSGISNSTISTSIYKNDGNGFFTLMPNTPIINVCRGTVSFADIDNDNDQDILVCGETGSCVFRTRLYLNNGSGIYSLSDTNFFEDIGYGNAAFVDIDNDTDLDFLIIGARNIPNIPSEAAFLYRNTTCNKKYIEQHIACDTFTWIDGVTYSANNSTASVSFTNSNGCDSVIVLNLTIEPDTRVIVTDPIITSNARGSSYQWLDCGNNYIAIQGETSKRFTPTINGSYAVEVTKNGCIDTSNCVTIVSTGIADFTPESISVFPNPNNGNFSIIVNYKAESIMIYDIKGNLIKMVNNPDTVNNINLNVAPGLYILNVLSNEACATYKLLIK
jgi:hypothetical protein